MTRLPRDVSGAQLARRLEKYGYRITGQTGSHIRLTTQMNGEHHVTLQIASALASRGAPPRRGVTTQQPGCSMTQEVPLS